MAAKGQEIDLTPAEHAWLLAHPRIRVGCTPDWLPFSFAEADGKLSGIDIDMLALLSQRLGVDLEMSTASTWTAVYAKGLAREVDVLAGTARTPEREPYFRFTNSYESFPVVIIERVDTPFLSSVQDLVGRRVASVRDYALTLDFQREYPGIHLVLTDTVEEAMQLVAGGQAEAVVTNLANASFVIKTHGLTNLRIAGILPQNFKLRYAVRSDWPELADILDKGIASLTPADLQSINDRWIRIDYASVVRWDVIWKTTAAIVLVVGIAIALIVARSRRLAYELAQRVRLQSELEESRDRLAQLNDEKAELLRMAAHDLRGPLTGVLLNLDLAQHGGIKPEEALPRIRSHVEQMILLMTDLLDSESIEDGRRKLTFGVIDAAAVLNEVLASLAPAAARKRIRFDTSGVSPVPPALADTGALRQIVENLVSNALKFSPPGCVVWLVLREWNDRVRFEVRDEGPGVQADEVERIFAKYVRGSARPTAGEKSTGLGLSIVRQLVTAMNGRAWCENEPGKGAAFIVVLPVATLRKGV
ncbi:MAG TPA: transporter substrate-binding domain-containing protein [Opitutaceae bacterium]|nr:transporter substrate-binding domain-containing protein [Opitutaceae bacterium]